LGKRAVKKKCLRCGREFFDKPKKNKLIKEWEEKEYCQRCRHLISMVKQRPQKERARIRVIADKIDLRQDVEVLRAMERFNPAALDRLREPLNKKKAPK